MTTFILLVKWSTAVPERRSRKSPAGGFNSERSKLGHKRCWELIPSDPDGCRFAEARVEASQFFLKALPFHQWFLMFLSMRTPS